jgi:DNA-binding PadR family transcriptional regulator
VARRPTDEDAAAAIPVGLDKLLEHRLRLTICVLLSRHDRVAFSRMKELTGETDGNLGANLRRLEDAGYLAARKEFVKRRPVTWYTLTAAGRRVLRSHLDALSELIRSAQGES